MGSALSIGDRRVPRLLQDVASQDLLYVSNLRSVTIYSYPRGRLEGTLKGLYEARGECVDQNGDVFVTNVGADQILAYAHGARKRFRALPGYGLPEACSIDPTSGDLATADSDGTIAIYKNAQGEPRVFKRHSPFKQALWCSYDNKGNLFVDGLGEGVSNFVLAELPRFGRGMRPVTLDQSMGYPGGVQWDGKYLNVGSYESSGTGTPVVYRFKISADRGRAVGMTTLGSGASDVRQFWIQDVTLIAPTQRPLESDVFFYAYPRGGKATKKIRAGLDSPVGAVVSLARGR